MNPVDFIKPNSPDAPKKIPLASGGEAQVVGGEAEKKPEPVILTASILDTEELWKAEQDYVKMNMIKYEFPQGFGKVSIVEECRAMGALEDFDTMFDLMMGMLAGKDCIISLLNPKLNGWVTVAAFHVTHKEMNLRGVDFLDRYPIVIYWMTEFFAGMLTKKFPLPGSLFDTTAPNQTAKTPGAAKKQTG